MAPIDTLPAKTVQQMAMDHDQPPSKYIFKSTNKFGPLETSPPFAPVPVIDISRCLSPCEQDELDKLRSALTTWGCFQVVNHGLEGSDLDNVRQVTKQFFDLPLEEKRNYLRETGSFEGYGNDISYSENEAQNWCDRLSFMILPRDQRKLRFWPENPSNFREIVDDYTAKINSISVAIYKAMAKCLDLEESSFAMHFTEKEDVLHGRFMLYPPCPTPDQVLGLKIHSDRSGITIILQDPVVEGLQILNDGKWYMVPVIRDALFINLGDQMQIVSNGIFKTSVHRVVTNKGRERISVAMFSEPGPNKEIGPVDVLVDEKRPRVYKTVKNYAIFNQESSRKGITGLDALQI